MSQRGRWRYVAAGILHPREKCTSEAGTPVSQPIVAAAGTTADEGWFVIRQLPFDGKGINRKHKLSSCW